MNILVLNGSPKGEGSNSLKITTAFLDGLNSIKEHNIEIINISKKNIDHCHGCFVCWTKTPGKCIIKDDMAELIEKYIKADLIVWSFPLYYFGMPSKIKAFLDRLLPTNLPYIITKEDGANRHAPRYDLSHQRHVLISTCGFYDTNNNYDALIRQFEIMFDDKLTKILCAEGELFKVPELNGRTSQYLSLAKKAGEEFGKQGSFSEHTKKRLSELLYPASEFVKMANASWDISDPSADYKVQDKSHKFIKQMSATYNPQSYINDVVIEMNFIDIDKTYQLCLGKEECSVKTHDFTPYNTKIETTFELWLQLSEGKVNGPEAMMQGKYKVLGDFSTMMKMSDYFGIKKTV
ncbi:NAD(P)H-dependent oxidoreductase [Clostridium akagii]|uniref:NAD(P)H-dependent oxidoreductase n=1 Tax=Clostridium akagii TaxID=91623 RepID=UPI00068F0933|nr:NAD(P)H-dependent oxidoreductase [Clostridium akagii]